MLIVREFKASPQFYSGVLGLPGGGEAPYGEFGSDKGKVCILDSEFWGTVGGHSLPSGSASPGEGVVLAIKLGDVDAEYARIHVAGVAIDSPPPIGR